MNQQAEQNHGKKTSPIETANQIPKMIGLWFGAIAAVGAALPYLSRYWLIIAPATLLAGGSWIWRSPPNMPAVGGKSFTAGSCFLMVVSSLGMAIFLIGVGAMNAMQTQLEIWDLYLDTMKGAKTSTLAGSTDRIEFAYYGSMICLAAAVVWSGAFLKRLSAAITEYVDEQRPTQAAGTDTSVPRRSSS